MKRTIILFLIVASLNSIAQTQKVVNQDSYARLKETYYVLSSDKKTMEGEYKVENLLKRMIQQEGHYHNDKKEGVWKDYGLNGNLLLTGNFVADVPSGIWNAYNTRNQLQVQYNYDTNQLLYFKPAPDDSTRVYEVVDSTKTFKTQLDRCPVYLNGNAWRSLAIARNLRYPEAAYNINATGEVIVEFTIDKNGRAYDYKTQKTIGWGLDAAAIRAVVLTGGKWLPGILNGKPVSVRYSIPVQFVLRPAGLNQVYQQHIPKTEQRHVF